MDELQGLNLINVNGEYRGIIERNFYSPNADKYIIHYKTPNGYDKTDMTSDHFKLFKSYVKIKSDRYDIIKSKDIKHIYHFSPIQNAPSILETGIVSRKFAKLSQIPIVTTDPNRFDGKLDMISASISFPNYKMLYKLTMNGMTLVICDISPRILLSKLDTEFYYTNAASLDFQFYDSEDLQTNEAFLSMFDKKNRDPGIPNNYPTDPQAEILVNNIIKKDFINEIIIPGHDNCLEKLCNDKGMNYVITKSLHKPRCDWSRW